MKRFEFPLESVLRLRRFRESEARQALAEAVVERNRAEAELARTRSAIELATDRLTNELTAWHPATLATAWWDLESLEQLALKQAEVLADKEDEVQRRRETYLAAQQERKPLERLREEMQRAHDLEAERVEQAQNDETAMISFARRGREP